jgi:hypothetical protein
MKKSFYLIIPVLVPGILLVIMQALGSRQPPAWEPALLAYIAYQKSQAFHPVTIRLISASHASRPWNYQRDIPEIVFGTNNYYRTDQPAVSEGGGMPLPYPPQDLWCLLVEVHPAAFASAKYQVLFAAEHLDLYNAAWVIHAPLSALSDPGLRQKLDRIGCNRLDRLPATLAYQGE